MFYLMLCVLIFCFSPIGFAIAERITPRRREKSVADTSPTQPAAQVSHQCHDPRCPGQGAHKCHNLVCPAHFRKSA